MEGKMTLQELITNFTDKRVFFDDENYRGECTQICKIWAKQNGWPIPNSGGTNRAADYKNFTDGYDFIKNTPENFPVAGDIVVWGREVGSYGHVAIAVTAGPSNEFQVFDQNWPQGSPCRLQVHNYYGVVGWLRHQENNPPQAPTSPEKYFFGTNLSPGTVDNEDVSKLQLRLKQLGYFPAEVDCTGNYKSITKKAVFELQQKYGVVQNSTDYGAGYFGPRTRAVINQL